MTDAVGEHVYRQRLQALMKQTVDDQIRFRNWTYAAVRPQEIIRTYSNLVRVYADCSDGCRDLARLAGVPDDPAGTNYASYGNSRSIWLHLHHAPSTIGAQTGDIFTFGFYSGEKHACMAFDVTDQADPLCWNLGTQGQPAFKRLSHEIVGHRGMHVTLCVLNLPPDPPPTHEDKLRAMTGWYAWVAWKLGEGVTTWKPYGPANAKVRPAVPRVIPPIWWRDLSRFLLARKRGDKATSQE